jgi:hypothetical protein
MSARYRIATVGTATLCLLWAHTAFAWSCDGPPGSQASRGKDKPAQSNKRLSRASPQLRFGRLPCQITDHAVTPAASSPASPSSSTM